MHNNNNSIDFKRKQKSFLNFINIFILGRGEYILWERKLKIFLSLCMEFHLTGTINYQYNIFYLLIPFKLGVKFNNFRGILYQNCAI